MLADLRKCVLATANKKKWSTDSSRIRQEAVRHVAEMIERVFSKLALCAAFWLLLFVWSLVAVLHVSARVLEKVGAVDARLSRMMRIRVEEMWE